MRLPDNRAMAKKRLESTERRLKHDPVIAEKYKETIDGYVQKGYAKKLPPENLTPVTSKQWFLPHHAVLNPNKLGKVRIV